MPCAVIEKRWHLSSEFHLRRLDSLELNKRYEIMQMHRLSRSKRRGVIQSGRLEEEIATLQQRLDQIGPDGDCGYEKAMIRFFQEQIDMRRQALVRIQSNRNAAPADC